MSQPPANGDSKVRYVVGIGASAGGLEALEALFRRLPAQTGMAFVVVQHLSPDFRSQMGELISRWTEVPVRVAEHEMRLEPDTIFLMPPRAELIVSGERLLLKERSEGLALPIDQFLRSAANDAGDRAIAVILSGTGSDGSRGVVDVHQAGGFVVVQSEESAKFNGMPKNAIETGMADLVLHPGDIPAALVRHADHLDQGPLDGDDPAEAVKEGGLRAVFALLRGGYGIDFSSYKPGTIGRRLERRLLLTRTEDLSTYVEQLRDDRKELDALYQDLLIGVTQFFRDPESFAYLEQHVLPSLVRHSQPDRELRCWVAGCATGEEAYSLAMLLVEIFEQLDLPLNAKVFATDVHRASLDIASAGIYDEEQLGPIGEERRARFFLRENDRYRVVPELRRMIVFAPHDVIRDAPFTKLDLVTCRNLLIYLQPAVQRKVLSLFHFGLRTGGILFLGPSESPGDIGDEFDPIEQHAKLFRKRRDVRLFPGMRASPVAQLTETTLRRGPVAAASPMADLFAALLDDALPPSVLLDQHYQIVHSFGDVSPLLRFPRGRPSLSLLDMLDGELKLAISGALHRASRARGPIAFSGVKAPPAVAEEHLDIEVRPIELPREGGLYFLVSLETALDTPSSALPPVEPLSLDAVSRDRLEGLEAELRHTKENLQATIEELEASNEELQATNEELLASNEELQSTNEELHSVNEELYTVNAEYQRKIDQLTELTDDMDNLLLSTEVHTLFLDEHLCIRKFTPAMAEVFNLVDHDVGRRIDSFVHTIEFEGLTEVLRDTLGSGRRFEAEVSTAGGPAYLMRALPYRGTGRRSGVVLTLTDITDLRRVENELRNQVKSRDTFLAMLSHELRNPLAAITNAQTLLARRCAGDDRVHEPLRVIRGQSSHMQRLLDDLLDVARVTQGKINLRHETLDLIQLGREAVDLVREAANRHSHALEVELGHEPLWVRGDRARIAQIFENLLTNAIKYTRDGGHVRLSVAPRGGEAVIEVRDDGAGIDEATLERIFEMFVQAEPTLDRSQGGLGVGLTLTHQLVTLHDGEISVHSEGPGRGTQVIVRLPTTEAPASAEGAGTASPAGPVTRSGPVRLVVVEDRAEIRDTLAELLEDEGYEVFTAADGLAGLETIRAQRPSAALLDVGLPGIDGYELARRVRDDPRLATTPLIAMTGYGSDQDRADARAAGFDEHLTKPVDLDAVLDALARLDL